MPLLSKLMTTESQWKDLSLAAMDLEREYAMRRTMLMTRLKATLQSFLWKDQKGGFTPALKNVVSMQDFQNRVFTNVTAADVLAARRDMTVLTKVSSVPPSTRDQQGSLTKIKIGRVPDRGGTYIKFNYVKDQLIMGVMKPCINHNT